MKLLDIKELAKGRAKISWQTEVIKVSPEIINGEYYKDWVDWLPQGAIEDYPIIYIECNDGQYLQYHRDDFTQTLEAHGIILKGNQTTQKANLPEENDEQFKFSISRKNLLEIAKKEGILDLSKVKSK